MSRVVPEIRIEACNDAPVRPDGDYVLYWMIAARRAGWNFGLQRAVERSIEFRKPLVILEPLNCDYRWASDRLHQFILDGMEDNARDLQKTRAFYYPYVEPAPASGKGLLAALARPACVVVTDDYPCFMLPKLVAAAARIVDVRLEQVDSNGLLPLRATERVFPTAFSFRRFLAKHLGPHLEQPPEADPLKQLRVPRLASLPSDIRKKWPPASFPMDLSRLPLDHTVGPASVRGGSVEARRTLDQFVRRRLGDYAEERNEPERDATSGLSPYLHFGHLSAHEIHARLGKRNADEFRDQLVTWRELGFNLSSKRPDYDRYESLPAWARKTLDEHAGDPRSDLYTLAQFEAGDTHDPLWNAAQMQLVREGRLHNYLRMLWGKKILQWTRSPREALEIMIELNNKYALDGRDPNSYSGIFWVLGRYDRAWGPERPIFGKIRYMTSENTARKVRVKNYIARYAPSRSISTRASL
jgi:deoxyribodipyrimidine photo-lyase